MIDNMQIVKELKPVYVKNEDNQTNLQILQNRENGKYYIFDKSKNKLTNKAYDEIDTIEIDSNNLFMLLNENGKCGIYDFTSNCWVYEPQYKSIRFIDSENSVQRKSGTTYMCVLELGGVSGLFTFTKENGQIIDKQSLIPIANYDNIQTNLFSDNISSMSTYNGLRCVDNFINNYLFVEIEKDGKKGCVVIKNQISKSKYNEACGGEFEQFINVDAKYQNIRPSEFNGVDGIQDGEITGDEVYLYDTMKHCIGDKTGVYYPIDRKIILNNREVIKNLERGLLLFESNDNFGVLHNGLEIIPAKFSPQMMLEEVEDSEDNTTHKFMLSDKDLKVYEYQSNFTNWNKYLQISKYDMRQTAEDYERRLNQFFENLFNETDDEEQR